MENKHSNYNLRENAHNQTERNFSCLLFIKRYQSPNGKVTYIPILNKVAEKVFVRHNAT